MMRHGLSRRMLGLTVLYALAYRWAERATPHGRTVRDGTRP